ncbi:hypothetical protein GCAAIG_13625 [Candidatus Electronema halotolerans]
MSSSRKTALGEILADSVLKQAGIRKHLEKEAISLDSNNFFQSRKKSAF